MDKQKTVTITFPSETLARLWLAWLTDGGGHDDFYMMAAQETGMYTSFEQTPTLDCTVNITGRVVDDDDPDMFGAEEGDQ